MYKILSWEIKRREHIIANSLNLTKEKKNLSYLNQKTMTPFKKKEK